MTNNGHKQQHEHNRFTQAPMLVYWEVTRACDLACRHCRAEAQPHHHPLELSTAEGLHMLDQLRAFGDPPPHIVFTGGDPLKRDDLFIWIERAVELGFLIAITPSGTPLLTQDIVQRFKDAGAWMMSMSLDGSTVEKHDAIRQVPGTYDRTIQGIRWAKAAGLPLQINTLVCAETYDDVPAVGRVLADLGVERWSLFFLVQTGRGAVLGDITPQQSEEMLNWLYDYSKVAPFVIKTTEAHHYRRIAVERAREEGDKSKLSSLSRGFGVRDGSGVMFISHIGEIYPAGFLPIAVDNVRKANPVDVYRNNPLFRSLRDADQYKGKCGVCEYRHICGGSRARAYAATGDPLESDPLCLYQPRFVAAQNSGR